MREAMADQGMCEDPRSEDLPREGHGAGSNPSSGVQVSFLPCVDREGRTHVSQLLHTHSCTWLSKVVYSPHQRVNSQTESKTRGTRPTLETAAFTFRNVDSRALRRGIFDIAVVLPEPISGHDVLSIFPSELLLTSIQLKEVFGMV